MVVVSFETLKKNYCKFLNSNKNIKTRKVYKIGDVCAVSQYSDVLLYEAYTESDVFRIINFQGIEKVPLYGNLIFHNNKLVFQSKYSFLNGTKTNVLKHYDFREQIMQEMEKHFKIDELFWVRLLIELNVK